MSKRNNLVKADSFVWSESKQRVVGLYFKFFKFPFKPGPEYSKISGFGRLYELAKPDELIKKFHSEEGFQCGLGERIYRFGVDGRPIRIKKRAVSKISGFVWTGPEPYTLPFLT